MDSIPIKLNFFKTAERFIELTRLDSQYNLMINDTVKRREYVKQIPSSVLSINLPTWNVEKKILRWSYLKHKHLGSALTTDHLKSIDFLDAIGATDTEVKLIGGKHIIENLVAHGFADNCEKGILFNQEGLSAGSLISDAYVKRNISIEGTNPHDLWYPFASKTLGYRLLYFTAWALIVEALVMVSMQLISILGLLDDLKILFWEYRTILYMPIIILAFLPLISLFAASLLIRFPKWNYRHHG